jgi:hypothetical protein
MEQQILETIDFEIPATTAYAAMTSEFSSLEADRRTQMVLAGQCLKFLQEAVKISSDFSLCGELGPKIVRLYLERRLQDGRLISVYRQIQNKKGAQVADGISTH